MIYNQRSKHSDVNFILKISNYKSKGPVFGYEAIRYSPEDNLNEFEYLHNYTGNSSQVDSLALRILKRQKFKQPKELLRSYDIDKIRYERVLNSFTIGRKLKHKENTGIQTYIFNIFWITFTRLCYLDKRINSEIENIVQGLCRRRPTKGNRKSSMFNDRIFVLFLITRSNDSCISWSSSNKW